MAETEDRVGLCEMREHSGLHLRTRTGMLGLFPGFAIIALIAIFVGDASGAVISTAALSANGNVVELRFEVSGRNLQWHATTSRQELVIDLAHTRLAIRTDSVTGRERPPVRRVTASNYEGSHARITIEVTGKVDYAIASLPRELIIRLAPSGVVPGLASNLFTEVERSERAQQARFVPQRYRSNRTGKRIARDSAAVSDGRSVAANDAHGRAPALPSSDANHGIQPVAITPPHPEQVRPVVVIDAGHGGRDPGTQSSTGVLEKNVALQIATRLSQALAKRGLEPELTRSGDTFLSLAQRTQMANRAGADLFISIHLNSSPDTSTSGIETYYLNNTTDRATIRLARMENEVAGGYSAAGPPNLNYILTDLRQGYKANESASLARMIEAESAATAGASLGIQVNALGAKRGPFYVLVGAEMPSVLVECGFLSNSHETVNLADDGYQQALADGIADAVVHYFNADAAVGNL